MNWWISHNPQIIQWLLASIVFVSAVVVGVSLFRKKSGGIEVSDQFEDTLKRILEQTKSAAIPSSSSSFATDPKAVAGGNVSGSSEAGPLNVVSIAAGDPDLVKKLTDTQAKIESLTKQVSDLEGQKGKAAEFEAKIKELEGKLQEYEIIEDDIADLNKYKEENAKLKEQLGQGPSGDLVGSFEKTVSENKIIDEQVKMEKPAEATPAAEVAAATPAPAPTPVAAPAKKAPEAATDDLFAEFARETEGLASEMMQETMDGEANADGIDTDKMLSEVSNLDTSASSDSALEEVTDFEKMTSEADQLGNKS